MKNFLRFILILLSNFGLACGFYPYGDDVRMSLFSPAHFHYHQFSEFDYSANTFYSKQIYQNNETMPNDKLWANYCQNKASAISISEVMNQFKLEDINPNSKNEFIHYLYTNKKSEALEYLKFAKTCEQFNTWMEDPWERNEVLVLPKRKLLVTKALQNADSAKEKIIKKRYAFLAMRMAFYNQQFVEINQIYSKYFAQNPENVIDYFAMYFQAIAEKNEAKANYYFAQVFMNVPEKRFISYQKFYGSQPIENVLDFAKTNDEKASVYLLYSMKPDKNLDYINAFYQLKPNDEALSFLLLREINKMEDWVLTPYYTVFQQSLLTGWNNSEENISTKTVFDRVETDRVYAGKVLEFVKNIEFLKVENQDFWKLSTAYLEFMTKDYDASLSTLNQIQSNDSELNNQKEIIKTLLLFANQKKGQAVIPNETRPIILKNKDNKRFIFALARELEYLGNSTDAGLLMSNSDDANNYEDYQSVFWKTINNRPDIFSDYYWSAISYIDAVYTPFQIQQLIVKLNENQHKTDEFSVWLYSKFQNKTEYLNEMLGMKYLRENNLKNAVSAFKKNNAEYWNNQNSLWERNDAYNSYLIIRDNPFYTLDYTPDFIKPSEIIKLNKLSVTQKLINYIEKANDTNEKNRAYYYFLVANCYYNMTENGNAWMMKRNYLGSYNQSVIVDNEEFNSGNLAKKYYLLAKQFSSSEKMKALCLRMAGRCEKFKQYYEQEISDRYNYDENFEDKMLEKNQYYQELKNQYASDYETLMSNCNAFRRYFSEK